MFEVLIFNPSLLHHAYRLYNDMHFASVHKRLICEITWYRVIIISSHLLLYQRSENKKSVSYRDEFPYSVTRDNKGRCSYICMLSPQIGF
jgi:hypothetical protein